MEYVPTLDTCIQGATKMGFHLLVLFNYGTEKEEDVSLLFVLIAP